MVLILIYFMVKASLAERNARSEGQIRLQTECDTPIVIAELDSRRIAASGSWRKASRIAADELSAFKIKAKLNLKVINCPVLL